jgi:uncharacterized protein YxeA
MQQISLYSGPKKLLGTVFVLSALIFVLVSSVEDLGFEENIWIEAENADYVKKPLYIENKEDASNGKMITCLGAHQNTSGIAKYSLSGLKEGKYYFWGRCYWPNNCANIFRLRYDNKEYNFGNDQVYNKWHWIKGPSLFFFDQGDLDVFLLSHDQNAQVDEILFTMDPEYIPYDRQQQVYLLDFEDSLINKLEVKNSVNWSIIKDSVSSICLSGIPKENKEIALLNNTRCDDDFIFQVIAKKLIQSQSELLLILDYIDDRNYRFISIDHKMVRYCRLKNDHEILVFSEEGDFLSNQFKSISLAKMNEYLKLKIEGKTIFNLITESKMKGKIGFGAFKGGVLIDNLAYYFPASFIQEDDFHDNIRYSFFKDRPDKIVKPFENMKEGKKDWWAVNGNWNRIAQETEYLQGTRDSARSDKKPAMLLWGNDFWSDYRFNVAVKVKDHSGFGICFCFQDSLNYYLFRWIHNIDGSFKRQLLKIEDGNEKILTCDQEGFHTDTWYNLGAKASGGKLTAYVNHQPVLITSDSTFRDGRLGFWTNSLKGACFDDVKLDESDNDTDIENIRNYTFYSGVNGKIASSLCDWDSNTQKNIKFNRGGGVSRCYLSKELFKELVLKNINKLYGDFKIEITTTDIPKDIDLSLEFISQDSVSVVYKFMISNDRITLLKNEKILTANNSAYNSRGKVGVSRVNNRWVIKVDAERVIECEDETDIASWNMTVGYSGIGKGQLFLNQISVEDQL